MRPDLSYEEIEAALSYVDPDDRETWVRMGMAVHDALGADGFAIWDSWSRRSEKYREATARGAWRLFRPGGGITIGSLIKEARAGGWSPTQAAAALAPRERPRRAAPEPAPAVDPEAVARQVRQMIERSAPMTDHPYLTGKGLKGVAVQVYADKILVPMYDVDSGEPTAVQLIAEDGSKLFAPRGCRTARCVYLLSGSRVPRHRWWVEGFATGLTVLRALHRMCRYDDQVTVCFSSGTLQKVARGRRSVVIADHDWWHCGDGHRWDYPATRCSTCGRKATAPAGESAARRTRLQWWQPPDPGTDANDYVAEHGLDALSDALLRLVAGRPILGPAPVPESRPQGRVPMMNEVVTPERSSPGELYDR